MQPVDDSALLRQYVENQSDDAFAGLVARHINLVYSVAFRQTGNPHHAEEVTQAVFIILAKKAGKLRHDKALSSWLFQATRLAASNFIRGERRRHHREQEAHMQSVSNEPAEDTWQKIRPLLDSAVAALNESDRRAIVLRFYEGRNLREIGEAMGASEEAAKKRVSRALERLQSYFVKRGISSTTATLAGVISANSVHAAPALLAKSVTAAAVVKGATASASTLTLIKGAMKVMAWSNAKTAAVSAVVIGLAALTVIQHKTQADLRAQNEALQRQMAQLRADNEKLAARPREITPHLPAPQIQMAAIVATNLPQITEATNLYQRLYHQLNDKPVKLTRAQTDSFLDASGRNAATLLAAFRTSGDLALLKEAMEKFPNDPQVAFETVAYYSTHNHEITAADQRKWLDTFQQSAPDNALANYLSAVNYFNSGRIDEGVRDLVAAAGKPLDDYTSARGQNDVEAFLAAGYSLADSEVLATSQLLLPQLAQFKQLALNSADLAGAYRQAGDNGSAELVLLLADSLGAKYATPTPGEPTVSQLVGIAIEQIALRKMDPASPYGDNGLTVQDRLNQLTQQRANVQQTSQQVSQLLPSLTDQDWIIYKNRWMMFGEENAQRWVIGKYGQQ